MKARVKATGEIVEVAYHGLGIYVDMNQWDKEYQFDEIVVLDNGDPDYWTRLEHQYAGMAMQSYVSNNVYLREIREMCKEPQEMRDLIADLSILLATTLIQKLKKKEERK